MTDIEGSTRRWEKAPDAMEAALGRHDRIAEECVAEFGGTVVKHTGDGVFAVFDSGRALECAMALQSAVEEEEWADAAPLRIRAALHAGASRRRGGDYFGPAVSRTARLLEAAWGGQTVLTAAALEVCGIPHGARVRDLGAHMFRDLRAPVRVFEAYRPDLREDPFPPLRSLSSRPNNLPQQPTPFVGRKRELARLLDLARSGRHRLITILGIGGMGKTRLALHAAGELLDDFADGVYLVRLAGLEDPADLYSAIAVSIGLPGGRGGSAEADLADYLRAKSVLLVLDNFEHLHGAAPAAAELLTMAARLRILATSRTRLGLACETVFRLEGMAVPGSPDADPETSDAVRLFMQHLERHVPSSEPGPAAVRGAAGICRLLGGTPLAIELAASWAGMLAPSDILDRLRAGLDLLAEGPEDMPARHRSMQRVFDYSWKLLAESERRMLGRLLVFSDGFDTRAALEVADAALLDLRALQDKSLLSLRVPGRLSMHRLLKGLAEERAAEMGLPDGRTADRHMGYYLGRLGELSPAGVMDSYRELAPDLGNFRRAWLHASANGRRRMLLESASPFRWLHQALGRTESGFALLRDAAYGMERGACRARLMLEAAWLAVRTAGYSEAREIAESVTGDFARADDQSGFVECLMLRSSAQKRLGRLDEAERLAGEYMARAGDIADDDLRARCLLHAGDIANHRRDFDEAASLCSRARKLFRRAGNRMGAASCSITLSNVRARAGDSELALQEADEILADLEGSGLEHRIGMGLLCRADALLHLGRFEESASCSRSAIERLKRLGDRWGMQMCFSSLALALAETGDGSGCREAADEALQLSEELGENYNTVEAYLELALALRKAGDIGRALEVAEEARTMADRLGFVRARCWARSCMAGLHAAEGDLPAGEDACIDAIRLLRDGDEESLAAEVMLTCLRIASEAGSPEGAEAIAGCLRSICGPSVYDAGELRELLEGLGLPPDAGAARPLTVEELSEELRRAWGGQGPASETT
jgi:predicted ATPase/tetratricopeptide (TPR) repeat protein